MTDALTCAVVLVQEVDLKWMAIVHDVLGCRRIVMDLERLQRRVEPGLARNDVNWRLPGSISNGEVVSPFIWTWTRNIIIFIYLVKVEEIKQFAVHMHFHMQSRNITIVFSLVCRTECIYECSLQEWSLYRADNNQTWTDLYSITTSTVQQIFFLKKKRNLITFF